jgi:hypothetical protein
MSTIDPEKLVDVVELLVSKSCVNVTGLEN